MIFEINEFVNPEYPIYLLIFYNVFYFSLTNKTVVVAVFLELYVKPFEINSLLGVIPNVKKYFHNFFFSTYNFGAFLFSTLFPQTLMKK